ncbi:MAG: SCO family protein [Burkholderiales bacterium]|nr:MAG: SCO family protein [Burkholderiales bacterium]
MTIRTPSGSRWGLACSLVVALLVGAPALHAHGLDKHTDAASARKTDAGAAAYTRSESAYTLPDVVLIDADDRPVKLRELMATRDPVMVNFIFTSCSTICPVMAHVFAEMPGVLGADGKQLRMVSISIDPEADTPLQLKAYAKSLKANDRWKFLTGSSEDIKAVQLAFAAYRGNKMNHEPLTLMRPTAGMSWVRIDGFAAPDALAREYRRMLKP